MADLIAGTGRPHVIPTSSFLMPIEAGKVKAYAVTTNPVSGPLASCPLDEAGLKGFNITIWNGALVPQGARPSRAAGPSCMARST